MASPKYQYEIPYGERNLAKKEIIFLRKLFRVGGKNLVETISLTPDHKFRKLFLDFWHNITHAKSGEGFGRRKDFLEAMCEVEPGTFDSYWLDRGTQQKRTYRTNRLDENLSFATRLMSKGMWKSLPILWRMNTDLNPDGLDHNSRIQDVTSYVIANNSEEANSVWKTMVLNPLGISQPQRHYGYSARFIGPSSYFNAMELNNGGLNEVKASIAKQRTALEERLENIRRAEARSEFAFALINQTLMMVTPNEPPAA